MGWIVGRYARPRPDPNTPCATPTGHHYLLYRRIYVYARPRGRCGSAPSFFFHVLLFCSRKWKDFPPAIRKNNIIIFLVGRLRREIWRTYWQNMEMGCAIILLQFKRYSWRWLNCIFPVRKSCDTVFAERYMTSRHFWALHQARSVLSLITTFSRPCQALM